MQGPGGLQSQGSKVHNQLPAFFFFLIFLHELISYLDVTRIVARVDSVIFIKFEVLLKLV